MTLRPSKIELPPRRQLDFLKINVFDLKVVLRAFWGSLGLLLGALEGFLGALGGLGGSLGAPGGSPTTLKMILELS